MIKTLDIIITEHARRRWAERYKNRCIYYEYSLAKKPKKAELNGIHKQCPDHTKLVNMGVPINTAYKLTPTGIVFVCTPDNVIVTVFPYANKPCKPMHADNRKMYRKGRRIAYINNKHKW